MKSVKTLIVSIILLSPICGFGYAITGSLAFANTITKYDVIDITKYHSISAITTENHTIVKDSSSNKADSAGSSVIGGGTDNKIDKRATHSVIPGGSDNTIEQYCEHSLAFGNGVTVKSSYVSAFYDTANPGKVGINNPDPHSTLQAGGSFATAIKRVSSDYSLTEKDHTVFTEGPGITITLPSAVTYFGREYYIRNTDTLSTVTLDVVPGGGHIDYWDYIIIEPKEAIIVQSDSLQWWRIADFK